MTRHFLVRAIGVLFSLMLPFEFGVAQRVPAAMPAGTQVQVRVIDRLSSEAAHPGDTFRGTLQRGIVINGRTQYARGCEVAGKVVNVHPSGRLSDPGELELALTAIRTNGTWYPVDVEPFVVQGESHAKNNVSKIGGGAALGAIIGGVAGGGKGAAIGAGVGTGAGMTAAAATGKKEAKVESETILTWVATGPARNTPPAPRDDRFRRSDRDDDDDRAADRRRRRDDDDRDDDEFTVFSARDRQVIRACYVDDRSNLPPGLAKKDRLPPGLEKQLRRNGSLPPGLQKRVQPLPTVCTVRLPRLPAEWTRVVISGRVILLDPSQRILDIFALYED